VRWLRRQDGIELGIDPALDVLHDLGLVGVVEKIVKGPVLIVPDCA
jgi:hypothetical protein